MKAEIWNIVKNYFRPVFSPWFWISVLMLTVFCVADETGHIRWMEPTVRWMRGHNPSDFVLAYWHVLLIIYFILAFVRIGAFRKKEK